MIQNHSVVRAGLKTLGKFQSVVIESQELIVRSLTVAARKGPLAYARGPMLEFSHELLPSRLVGFAVTC